LVGDKRKSRRRRPGVDPRRVDDRARPNRQGTAANPLFTGPGVERQQRITQVMSLSVAGLSVREIADKLAMPRSTVHDLMKDGFLSAQSLNRRQTLLEVAIHRYSRVIQSWWLEAVGGQYTDPQTGKPVVITKSDVAAKIVMAAQERISHIAALNHRTVDLTKAEVPEPPPFEGWTDEELERYHDTGAVPEGKALPKRVG